MLRLCRYLSVFRKNFLPALLFAWVIFEAFSPVAFGEGSRELTNGVAGHRPWLQYRSSTSTAGIPRRNTIQVYARAGEDILLGSSALGLGNGAIEWVAPDDAAGSCPTGGTAGVIDTRAEELAGPFPALGGYDPCTVTVGAGQEGIWEIEFISPDPAAGGQPPLLLADADWDRTGDQPAGGNVTLAWDVTVLDGSGAEARGRAFANYLALNMGANSRTLHSVFQILTLDGFLYQVDLNGMDPFGFMFLANSNGFTDLSGVPLFRSVDFTGGNLETGVAFQDPSAMDAGDSVTHKIFFNDPATDLPTTLVSLPGNRETWLARDTPIVPQPPTGLAFTGADGTPGQAAFGGGGEFAFFAPQAGTFTVLLDANGNGNFNDPEDVILIGRAVAGDNVIPWDGKDGLGNDVPPGNTPYNVQVNLAGGEVHFPFFDVENNDNGLIIERINGPDSPDTRIYFNDRAFNGGGFALPPDGQDSAGGGHAFDAFFGDERGIDTWANVPSQSAAVLGGILIAQADLSVTKTPSTTTPSSGGAIQYTIEVANAGPTGVTDTRVTDAIPAGLANATWTCAPAAACDPASGTGDIDTFVDLGVNETATLTLSAIVTGPEGVDIANTAGVALPPDVSDPDPTNNSDDATVTPESAVGPILESDKADSFQDPNGDGAVNPGETIDYQIEVRNVGSGAATGVVFTDTPDANTALIPGVDLDPAGTGTVTSGNGVGDTGVVWTIGALAPGQSVRISFSVRVDDPFPAGVTEVANQGIVASDQLPDLPTDNPVTGDPLDPTVTPIVPPPPTPALSATKRDELTGDANGDGQAGPGDTLTYTVVVSNTGNADAAGVVFSDTPGANLSLVPNSATTTRGTVTSQTGSVGVDVGTLAPGATGTITFEATIADPLPDGVTAVRNQGSASGTGIGPVSTDDPDTPTAGDPTRTPVVNPRPVLSATKRDALTNDLDSDGQAGPGDTLTYTVVVSSTGTADAAGVVFSDTPGANLSLVPNSVTTTQGTVTSQTGSVGVNVGTLAPGETATITFEAILADPIPDGVTAVQNQGTVSGTDIGSANTDDPDTAAAGDPTRTPVVSLQPALTATKRDALTGDALGDGFAGAGDTLTYTVVVSSIGTADAENVVFSDTPGANLTLVPGSATTTRGAVTVGNTAGDISVAVEIGTLAPGETATVAFEARIADPLPAAVRQVANQGTVSSDGLADLPTDDPDTDRGDDPTFTSLIVQPRLDLTKRDALAVDADADGFAGPGDTIRYTIVLRNAGNAPATGVELVDSPDANAALQTGTVSVSPATPARPVTSGNAAGDTQIRVDVGDLEAGDSVEVTFDAIVVDPLPVGVVEVRNQARTTSAELPVRFSDDPDTATPDDPTATPVVARPVLIATKTDRLADADGDGGASPGEIIRYEIRVENNGNTAATGVRIVDLADAATELVAGSVVVGPGATVETGNQPGDTSVSVLVDLLAAGDAAVVDFDVRVADPIPDGTTRIANQAVVGADGLPERPTDDPDTVDPDDPTVTPLSLPPVLSATKTDMLETDPDGDGAAGPGSVLRYLVTIANTGRGPATDVRFRDRPDPATTLINGTVQSCLSPGNIVSGNGAGDEEIEVEIGTIPPGEFRTVCFQVEVVDPLPAGIVRVANQGTVFSEELPALPTDDPDTLAGGDPTETPLTVRPLLSASKSVLLLEDANGDGAANPGEVLLYEVRLFNNGTGAATAVVYDDAPDSNTTLLNGTVLADPGTVVEGNDAGDRAVRVEIGTLPPGQTVRIAYRVEVGEPPPGVERLENQGFLSSAELPPVPTGDPSTPTKEDPTAFPLTSRPALTAVKVDTLLDDPEGDGAAGPGDELLYTVEIANTGTGAAANLAFADDWPDQPMALIAGSVRTDAGSVQTGNNAGDTGVAVSIPRLPAGETVRISWSVRLDDPFPPGLTEIANQGTASADGVEPLDTDDPDTVAGGDPTRTPVALAPRLEATKTAVLWEDANGDGSAGPGEVLLNTIVLRNAGTGTAPAVKVVDAVSDANLFLVSGTVQADPGVVQLGNGPADETVDVLAGDLAPGAEVRVAFQVRIASPLPADVATVSNQAIVQDGDGGETPTDDPDSVAPGDPTVTPVNQTPALTATKTAEIFADANGDGFVGPGDRIRYTVVVRNVGAVPATDAAFQDTPDVHTRLAAGTVGTDAGTVQTGNAPGDERIAVDIGVLAAGAEARVTFEVLVPASLPAGVTEIANQGTVSAAGVPDIPTDNPFPPGDADPTTLPVRIPDPVEPPTPPPAVPSPALTSWKSAALAEDRDGDGFAGPGDVLTYTVTIRNIGDGNATGVTFADGPIDHAALVPGSLETSRGVATEGSGPDEPAVSVVVGTLIPGDEATIVFDATVDDPLPAGVNRVENQGLTTSRERGEQPTDDPDTDAPGDPTVTPISAAPAVAVEKTAALLADENGDGLVGPGDRLIYFVTVVNDGNAAASGVNFTDTPDPNTTLVPGSVLADGGIVLAGNGEGDTSVSVIFDSLPAGGVAVLAFEATVNEPLPAGVTAVANQGAVFGPEIPDTPTDDPGTDAPGDPTVTPVSAAPLLVATKADIALDDANGDGRLNPGETFTYEIRIENRGNASAFGLLLTDRPETGATLVPGSVVAGRGAILSGNRPGDRDIGVDIGDLPPGGAATITFRAVAESVGPEGGEAVNQARIEGANVPDLATDDPDTAEPGDATRTPVVPVVRIDLAPPFGAKVVSGECPALTWEMRWTNDRNDRPIAVRAVDPVPEGTEFLPGTLSAAFGEAFFDAAGNRVVWQGVLQPGEDVWIRFQTAVPEAVERTENQGCAFWDRWGDGSAFDDEAAGQTPVCSDDPATSAPNDPTVWVKPPDACPECFPEGFNLKPF